MKLISVGAEETSKIAQDFLNTLEKGSAATVVALEGDLGAGKTNFAQTIGRLLGIEENMHSPTFVIEKIYDLDWKGFKNLIHIDAYRIEKDSELLHLGWKEIIREPENLILIEWPENASNLIPSTARRLKFRFMDENTREIEIDEG